MKKSIRFKLFIGITCFVLVIVGLSWILNTKYLEKYYIEKKKDSLMEYGKQIQLTYDDNIEKIEDELAKIQDVIAGDITILTDKGEVIYSSLFMEMQGKWGKGRGNLLLTMDDIHRVAKGDVILEQYVYHRLKTKILVLSVPLESNQILILQTPVEAIKDSVEIVQNFYIYVGVISLIIGIIVAFLFSRKFTKPIVELNEIANNMARLDFSKKCLNVSEDEIGQLGNTINYLSDKLDITISELNSANEKLKRDIEKERQLELLRKEFVSSVSHELKTPIALIQGYAEGLRDNVIVDEENKEFYCEVIIDESDKMGKLVKDLLELSQIESGHYELNKEKIEICGLVEDVVNKYKLIFEDKKINLIMNIENNIGEVRGDISKIEQVLINFINNAINHVDNEKVIKVNVLDKNNKIKIEIINTGRNIPKDELSKIWESFYRIDKARTRKYGGTGLGLSIVRRILELHKSLYGVLNLDDGVKFWFELDKNNDKYTNKHKSKY